MPTSIEWRSQSLILPGAGLLNLTERLWLFHKKKTLWNAHYDTLAAFRNAIAGFFDNIGTYRDQLASLITDNFRFIGISKPQVSSAQRYNTPRRARPGWQHPSCAGIRRSSRPLR
jgi:hypothetical protein